MLTVIHETAVIDPNAKLGKNVTVGPFTVIDRDVVIGDGTWISSHVSIVGHTTIGKNNRFFPFSSIGEAPQDLKYNDEPTRLEIGDNNLFRENCTVHRGTIQDQGLTKIGNNNLFMANSHVAHDCVVADHVILTNGAGLAGHVIVEDHAICGASVGVHQFCRIGQHSFLTLGALVSKDVVPYTIVCGEDGRVQGLNLVGLKRRGFSDDQLSAIRKAYKIIFREGLTVEQAVQALEPLVAEWAVVKPMLEALLTSTRGIAR